MNDLRRSTSRALSVLRSIGSALSVTRVSDDMPSTQMVHPPETAPNGSVVEVPVEPNCSEDDDEYPVRGLRNIVWNFTPSWFTVTMGTGIVSILLQRLPYNADWVYWLSIVFFALNILLFVIFSIMTTMRYIIYPGVWSLMIHHPTQSLFLGAIPMSLATIENMVVYACIPHWGHWATNFAWALWWIDVVLSILTCYYLPFVIMSVHEAKLQTMTALWLLPVVSTIVCASSGGIVAGVLTNPNHALLTIIVSYVLWGMGVPLAVGILVIYLQRLTLYHFPPRETIVSVFIPLGPLGQGGFGIMQLGEVAMKVFPQTKTLSPAAGEIFYVAGFMIAVIMWGFGTVWFFLAIASISRSKFPFNMGWWGFTFPIGVFALSTNTLGKELPSRFFSVLGTIFSLSVVILWFVVAIGTLQASFTGELFQAPCLSAIKEAQKEKKEASRKGEKGV